jgi:hypothetical protein
MKSTDSALDSSRTRLEPKRESQVATVSAYNEQTMRELVAGAEAHAHGN